MRKTLIYSALILSMVLGLTWSAFAAAPQSAPATASQASQAPLLSLDPTHGAVQTSSCTLTCPNDPVSCTSATGNCRWGDLKGSLFIVCDNQWHSCPSGI
jgi:hypothetical protein